MLPRRLSTLSIGSQQNDTLTAEIEYTRAIQQEFKHARPRRPKRKEIAPITIFEDVVEDQELVVHKPATGGSTLLARPAQKPARMSILPHEAVKEDHALKQAGQLRRRVSVMPQASYGETVRLQDLERQYKDEAEAQAKAEIKKAPRRRTIFVPADDTTMLTIHPGANTTNRLEDTFQLVQPQAKPSIFDNMVFPEVKAADAKPARRSRMSMAAAPKRLPLQHLEASHNMLALDIPGQNGGKENVPPRGSPCYEKDNKLAKRVNELVLPAPSKTAPSQSKLFEPTAASQARQSVNVRKAVPMPKPKTEWHKPISARSMLRPQPRPDHDAPDQLVKKATSRTAPSSSTLRPSSKSPEEEKPWKRSKCFVSAEQTVKTKLAQYPILSEDLPQPDLYEQSCLGHQEVAMTELVNEIFDQATPERRVWCDPTSSLRERMVRIYHQPAVTTMHNRLKASILYGALSRPKDMPNAPSLTQDLGLRRRFLQLWLDSYSQDALTAAAEVVIGRQLPRSSATPVDGMESIENLLDVAGGRRRLTLFLETFFVSAEDADAEDDTAGAVGLEQRRLERTVMRSLMLTWLLDQAKNTGAHTRVLFKRKSLHKASVAVLYSLSTLLLPSVGDIVKVLRRFDYIVSHVQDPLDEVTYHVDNIAIDLRDGVLLTRLVEILLYAHRSDSYAETLNTGDATVTIDLPDATVLEGALYGPDGKRCSNPLSQHLKMPCLGRSQKLYNVQVALSALEGSDMSAILSACGVTADDIVDGYREKTLSLVWAIVSGLSLERFVDWKELETDIGRQGAVCEQNGRKQLLKAWAKAHCDTEGVTIANLTTSFADGKAYHALIEAFQAYIPRTGPGRASAKTELETTLTHLGYSKAFTNQLSSVQTTVPSERTTVATLALLASRLLPLVRTHNAAVTLQRAYRRKHFWIIAKQRVALTRLATHCAQVVQTRNRIVGAATILQRAWRVVLGARLSRLNAGVGSFQVLAKGWLERRRLIDVRHRSIMQGSRVMGGW